MRGREDGQKETEGKRSTTPTRGTVVSRRTDLAGWRVELKHPACRGSGQLDLPHRGKGGRGGVGATRRARARQQPGAHRGEAGATAVEGNSRQAENGRASRAAWIMEMSGRVRCGAAGGQESGIAAAGRRRKEGVRARSWHPQRWVSAPLAAPSALARVGGQIQTDAEVGDESPAEACVSSQKLSSTHCQVADAMHAWRPAEGGTHVSAESMDVRWRCREP